MHKFSKIYILYYIYYCIMYYPYCVCIYTYYVLYMVCVYIYTHTQREIFLLCLINAWEKTTVATAKRDWGTGKHKLNEMREPNTVGVL